MVQLITNEYIGYTKLLNQNTNNFTALFLKMKGILELLHNDMDPPERTGLIKKAQARINWLYQHTNKDVMVPLFILDKYYQQILQFSKTRPVLVPRRIFQRVDWRVREINHLSQNIELSEPRMFYYLNMALDEAHIVLMERLRPYAEEQSWEIPTEKEGASESDW